MKLINRKRLNVQFNRYFSEGFLVAVFLFSILTGVIVSLWLPYDISKSYKGMNIGGFLVLLCILVPRSYDTEGLKRELSCFINLSYPRKEYFRNKVLIVNLMIGISVAVSTIIMFTLIDYEVFGYLGLVMERNFISFLKVNFINSIIYNLFYTCIVMVQILFIKVIPSEIGKLIFKVMWTIAFFVFWRGLIGDVYVKINAPNIALTCSIIFILIAYYIHYKFIMSLDV
ncbi:hypothetical protein [Clostridium lundense]|uniref:hypothetical protein n=1 Tax=Clostridium lundense TaxID=319475 RepID=UPI0004840897|nr:hypothetical protein [Clostridium lundense]